MGGLILYFKNLQVRYTHNPTNKPENIELANSSIYIWNIRVFVLFDRFTLSGIINSGFVNSKIKKDKNIFKTIPTTIDFKIRSLLSILYIIYLLFL